MAIKHILGLDLGTNSIGWAVVTEDQDGQNSSIEKVGVRTIHYDNFVNSATKAECKTPEKDFLGGKSISCNAGRTLLRGARRNLQRYKKRRELLLRHLKEANIITDETICAETGNKTTFETIRYRAMAATEQIPLDAFARVLLMINKKRGYKSARKVKDADAGQLIDGMAIARRLYEEDTTPGTIQYEILRNGEKDVPTFYRSDLISEFDRVWNTQAKYHADEMPEELLLQVKGVSRKATYAILEKPWNLVGEKRTTKGAELKIENAKWRKKAIEESMSLEQLVVVLQCINSDITSSSGYLGAIGDRSKQLYFNKQTVGQFQYDQLQKNPHYSLKNQVFYRQDYLDEFEKIWETQSKFYPQLTPELKKKIREEAIFFQRPLKSKKGELSVCAFEGREVVKTIDGKNKKIMIGPKVCPASSPLFQEFRIWGILNNIKVKDNQERYLTLEEKNTLFASLNLSFSMTVTEASKLIGHKITNYKEKIQGNTTLAILKETVPTLITEEYLSTDVCRIEEKDADGKIVNPWDNQPLIKLWHLLYSYEGDNSISGVDSLVQILMDKYHVDNVDAKRLANIAFEDDYSNLSSRALRKILPHMRAGLQYSEACIAAGYNHSERSLTKEQLAHKNYLDELPPLPKNSLRNPVVEKILNQMINVVNQVIATYGKPDEIRIEMARELKKSSKERQEMVQHIADGETKNAEAKEILEKEFGILHVTRNDILRYRLYMELKDNGWKTLYSNTYIPREKLFSKDFDIEHIIPQALLFDDSFANKTLEARDVNIRKGKMTAFDFICSPESPSREDEYRARIESMHKSGAISDAKYKKLLMKAEDIPSGFIDRDLRDSQYIAKKAREILEQLVPVVVATTGSVTARLREDWQLVDVMKELNWSKYDSLGQTTSYQNHDGKTIYQIADWSKRDDNRHHAMDAIAIAFTRLAYIQYLNNLNARIEKSVDDYIDLDMVELRDIKPEERSSVIYAIENKYLERHNGKLRFIAPMPLAEFRKAAKQQLESTLVSVKARNKVTTINRYKVRGENEYRKALTPRGSLHNDTIYGSIRQENITMEKVGASFSEEKILTVCNPIFRRLLMQRLHMFGNDPKKAFTGKNALSKSPIIINAEKGQIVPEYVKTKTLETVYTIRKPISPDLKIDKVVNGDIRKLLENRLAQYHGNAKEAFSNLDENPIWLNEKEGIQVKRVTIKGVSNATALGTKHDHMGKEILDEHGHPVLSKFVSTSGNHHVAIFEDEEGNLQEHVVSFYEATVRKNMGLNVIDKEFNRDLGWRFLFTMKQNEMFVFPNEQTGFNPNEIDLMSPDNYAAISPNLYRVQKIASKNYCFRHHLETSVENRKELNGVAYKWQLGLAGIRGIVKVRINHIGHIVAVGEY